MNCPYCHSPKRTETTYECWRRTDMDEFQRPEKCLRNEIGLLNDHINLLKSTGDELLEWLKDGTISESNYRLLANAWQRAKENKQ